MIRFMILLSIALNIYAGAVTTTNLFTGKIPPWLGVFFIILTMLVLAAFGYSVNWSNF